MSLEITIKQKGFFKKKLTRDEVLGNKLKFGYFDSVRIIYEYEEGMDPNDIIVYNPDCIGRGFTVGCAEEETKKVYMRLLYPTSAEEIDDFVGCVKRINEAWNGNVDIDMDGENTTIENIDNSRDIFKNTSLMAIKEFSENILKGEEEGEICLYCAMWILYIGRKEANMFVASNDLSIFRDYMNEKQSIDAFYPKPMFCKDDKGSVIGRYVLSEDVISIFPLKPTVPYGCNNPETGQSLEIDEWVVVFYSHTENDIVGDLHYEKLIPLIPKNKQEYYDAGSILISSLSLDDIKDLVCNCSN